jgi:hypothetical protein
MQEKVIHFDYVVIKKLVQDRLEALSKAIESALNSDLIFFSCDIDKVSETVMNEVVNDLHLKSELKNGKLTVMLTTNGGQYESVISMVQNMRRVYSHVSFIVPKCATSAGTLFCLSGSEIYLNKTSSLGPIDLQITFPNKGPQQSLITLKEMIREYEEKHKNNPEDLATRDVLRNMLSNYIIADNKRHQEVIRTVAMNYLKMYKFETFEKLDEQKQKKILAIPSSLIDKELLEANEIYFHDNKIFLEKANVLGLGVKDYSEEFPQLIDKIEEFDRLNMEYAGVLNFDKKFRIYSRLTTVPVVWLQDVPQEQGEKSKE